MSHTLLEIIQSVSKRLPLTSVPSVVVSSSEPMVRQMFELAQEEAEELLSKHEWSRLLSTWTIGVGAASPYQAPYPDDFDRLCNKAKFWRSDSNYIPLIGPLNSADWTLRVNAGISTHPGYWRRYQNGVQIFGVPDGVTVTAEYVSANWAVSEGGTSRSSWEADSDTTLFPEALVKAGIRWRWKSSKGLEYAEDMATYEREFVRAVQHDTEAETIHTSAPEAYPGTAAWPGTLSEPS